MRQSGLADLLPSLRETVYVGLSAGSMVMAPNIGEDFVRWKPPSGGDRTKGAAAYAFIGIARIERFTFAHERRESCRRAF